MDGTNYVELAAEIVSAYVSNNSVRTQEIPELIVQIHAALANVAAAGSAAQAEPEKAVPHIPIKKTITPDYIISLEDRRQYKSMKRHLSGRGLTPEQYRTKWGLPADYPMVAPNYAAQRSELAKKLGLGQLRKAKANGAAPQPATGAKRGRKPKNAEAAA